MSEFYDLAQSGYPQDRLMEMAGVGYRCQKCGHYVPEEADECGAHPCTAEGDCLDAADHLHSEVEL